VLAIALAGAIWQWRNAKVQTALSESRQLAAESQQALGVGGDLGLALQRVVEANERWPTGEAELALTTVLDGPLERFIFASWR
jgi:hypothetical protein